CVFYYRNFFSCQSIKKCRLPHIRPSHYSYNRFAHTFVSFYVLRLLPGSRQLLSDPLLLPLRFSQALLIPSLPLPPSYHPEIHFPRFEADCREEEDILPVLSL